MCNAQPLLSRVSTLSGQWHSAFQWADLMNAIPVFGLTVHSDVRPWILVTEIQRLQPGHLFMSVVMSLPTITTLHPHTMDTRRQQVARLHMVQPRQVPSVNFRLLVFPECNTFIVTLSTESTYELILSIGKFQLNQFMPNRVTCNWPYTLVQNVFDVINLFGKSTPLVIII